MESFFGEIDGIILFFPNLTPTIYAKESYTLVRITKYNIGSKFQFFVS